jgi:hypothetical protein
MRRSYPSGGSAVFYGLWKGLCAMKRSTSLTKKSPAATGPNPAKPNKRTSAKEAKQPLRTDKENDGGESILSGQPREAGGDRPK